MIYPALNRLRPWLAWGLALLSVGIIGLYAAGTSPFLAIKDHSRVAEVVIRADKPLGPINPFIYSLASPSPELIDKLKLKLWRWGGNPSTRYNWEKGNCWNAASDWEFRNGNYGNVSSEDRLPSGVADKQLTAGFAHDCTALITIPSLGWVARNDDNATASIGVPSSGGPPVASSSDAIAGYDPAYNRKRVSQRSLPRKGKPFSDPPDLSDDTVYQDEWVSHLKRKFGNAASGGVRYYAIDNEPDLWSTTHRDMHPTTPDRAELLRQFLDYADAIKDVDPTASVTGPVSWGWTAYFYSPRDQGQDNYATAADRKAHDDLPFVAWFLREVAAHDRKIGRRTLDVLDVHFYPQAAGVYGGLSDDATNSLRLRSTRALWDPDYTDESWIATRVALLPRLRKWIDEYYPGTRIGLTEWNWGADSTLNGGLAIGDVLGVLGRYGVDLACYWTAPAIGTPGFYVWKLYRNADDNGHGFGDTALAVEGGDTPTSSCYASIDARTGYPIVIVINKSPRDSAPFNLRFVGGPSISGADGYRYSGADLKSIKRLRAMSASDRRMAYSAPAYSITLIRCK